MNVMTILKPAPHCPIPFGHPCHRGYTPAEETQVRRTWARQEIGDDYDLTERLDYLEKPGAFK